MGLAPKRRFTNPVHHPGLFSKPSPTSVQVKTKLLRVRRQVNASCDVVFDPVRVPPFLRIDLDAV